MTGDPELDRLEEELLTPAPTYATTFYGARRGLGLTSLVAWISLAAQEGSLFGPGGVVPMEARVQRVLELEGLAGAMRAAPSLFYLVGGDASGLGLVTGLGVLASLAMIAGVLPGPAALVSYAAYVSFVSLGAPFLPLQWDTLLCEALVLAAIVSPWRLLDTPSNAAEPTRMARWACWLLPTRLFFASGLVKILSGDPTWRDGTAMTFHYWTQPLPSPLAPLADALPAWFHAVETWATLVLEIGLPLLVFFGVRGRAVLCGGIGLLMVLIAATGSFGFFNLLTVVLALPLLDDATFARLVRRPAAPPAPRVASRLVTALAGAQFALGTIELLTSIGVSPLVPDVIEDAAASISPFRIANGYGLFAVMTTGRDELVFLATEDGEYWEEYDFLYMPGDPTRAPTWCTPHMPRFDWMLWFAALGERSDSPWVMRVRQGLLEGRAPIRALFRREPFEGRRPRDVRIERRSYTFGDDGGWERGPPEPF